MLYLQTGFVETLKPQFTPGQVVTPGPALSTPQPAKLQLEPNPEIEQLKDQIKELSEKLETMRSKYVTLPVRRSLFNMFSLMSLVQIVPDKTTTLE